MYIRTTMAQDHHKPNGGGGRYYKDDSSRRGRTFYSSSSSSRNYNPYHTQHTSNPNSYPGHFSNESSRTHNSQQHSATQNPFSSRRSGSSKSLSGSWHQSSYNSRDEHGNGNAQSSPSFPSSSSSSSPSKYRRPVSGPPSNGSMHINNIPPTGPSRRKSSTSFRDDIPSNTAASSVTPNPNSMPNLQIQRFPYNESHQPKINSLSDLNEQGDKLNNTSLESERSAKHHPIDSTYHSKEASGLLVHNIKSATVPVITVDSNVSVVKQEPEHELSLEAKVEERPTQDPLAVKSSQEITLQMVSTATQPDQIAADCTESSSSNDVKECIYPMNRIESKVWELKHASKEQRRKHLSYLRESRLKEISQYSFVDESFLIFRQADAYVLHHAFMEIKDILEEKKAKLTDQFVYLNKMWQKDCTNYDKQLEKTYDNDTSEKKPKVEIKQPTPPPPPARTSSSRRSRHHGDSVRTEAEFMEILASLEQERERDPLIRAQYGAASIPDMIMDPIEKYAFTRVLNTNNLISDKDAWASRVLSDPIDNFTAAEHAKFMDIYVNHPKKFGRISSELGGLRTSEECVLHYYKTKKTTNYKQLVANKNKRSKKKSSKKKPSKSQTDNTATPDTSTAEIDQNKTSLSGNENTENELCEDFEKDLNGEGDVTVEVTAKDLQKSTEMVIEDAKLNGIQAAEEDAEGTGETDIVENVETAKNDEIVEDDDNATEIGIDEAEGTVPASVDIATGSKRKLFEEETVNKMQKVAETVHSPSFIEHSTAPVLPAEYGVDVAGQNPPLTIKTEEDLDHDKRSRKTKNKDNHISSYWSVQDITTFPVLLRQYGSKWDTIAEKIGTKSATMVKNYYQRGLVDHPEWQTLIMMSSETEHAPSQLALPHHRLEANDQPFGSLPAQLPFPQAQPQQHGLYPVQPLQVPANGPSMGYFLKPENAYSTSFPRPQLGTVLPQESDEVSHTNHVPQFVPISQISPVYSQYVESAPHMTSMPFQSVDHHPIPNSHRGHALSSILNASNTTTAPVHFPPITSGAPSFGNILNSNSGAPILEGGSESYAVGKLPRIMDLLNRDEPKSEDINSGRMLAVPMAQPHQPFKPNIKNIMNSSPLQVEQREQHPPQLPLQRSLPPQSTQQQQQQQQQQQPSPRPQPQPQPQAPQPSTYMGGTSALDALARIAFERK